MQYNIKPGVFESISGVSIGTFSLNVVTNFKLDGEFPFLLSDVVVKQGGTVISASNYTLSVDNNATTQESGQTAKTLNGAIKITNVAYTGVELNVSGSNFGAYVSNEATVNTIDAKVATKTSAVGLNIQKGEIARFAGSGQDIESDNSGAVDLWLIGTPYNTAGTLVRLDGDTFTATGLAGNQGKDPTDPANVAYWYEGEDEKELKKLAKNGKVCGGQLHAVHNRAGAQYAQNLLVGKKKFNDVLYNLSMIHLDGSVVTGNATLEGLLAGNPYIDLIAPDVLGTRTLVDMGGRTTRAMTVGGQADTLGEVQEDAMQKITGTNGSLMFGSAPVGASGVLATIISSAGAGLPAGVAGDDRYATTFDSSLSISPNTAKTNDVETRMANLVVGADYIIVMVPA